VLANGTLNELEVADVVTLTVSACAVVELAVVNVMFPAPSVVINWPLVPSAVGRFRALRNDCRLAS
jgi:hypothetical protein